MKLEIRWRRSALNGFLFILRQFCRDRSDRRIYLEFLLRSVEQELTRTKRRPSNSIVFPNVRPETRAWEIIPSRLWLLLVIREHGGWLSRILNAGNFRR